MIACRILYLLLIATAVANAFHGGSPASGGKRRFARNRMSRKLNSNSNNGTPYRLNLFDDGRMGNGGGNNGGVTGGMSLAAGGGDDSDSGSSSSGGLLAIIKLMLDSYNKLLVKYPNTTKILSSGFLGGLGDLLVQVIGISKHKEGGPTEVDWRRTLVFTSVCGLYIAPVIDNWFAWLNSLSMPSSWSKNAQVLVMLLIDQTIGGVLVNGGFLVAFEMAQRLIPPYSESREKTFVQASIDNIKTNLIPTVTGSWCVWPFANFINFRFIPLEYRLIFSNIVAVFWNMFLSIVVNR